MNPERWEQVAELHRAALECDESGRAAFLREACAGDEELRRERVRPNFKLGAGTRTRGGLTCDLITTGCPCASYWCVKGCDPCLSHKLGSARSRRR
jgi:hypothetical protein